MEQIPIYPSVYDTHRSLGSLSIYRHPPSPWLSLRESWREAPERAHRTNFSYEAAFLHELSAHPSPPPFGRYLSRRERQELCANFKQCENRDLTLRLPMLTKPLALPPSIDTRQALGSPSGRAGAKRLRGLTAPILPKNYPLNHRTDSIHGLTIEQPHQFHPQTTPRTAAPIPYTKLHSSTDCLHIPLPLPLGGTSPGGRGKSCVQASNRAIHRSFEEADYFFGVT